jgi:RecA-family ATPase
VENFILAKTLNGLFGDGGVGKDLVLLQLGIAMTCGAKWLGRDVKQGRVMYFPSEDGLEKLRRREDKITSHYAYEGTYAPVPKQFKIVPMVGRDTVLAVFDHKTGKVQPTDLYKTTCEMIDEFRPDLVIVGKRVNIFSVNQNEDAQACQCMALLTHICKEYQTSIIMPSHVSLRGERTGEGTSGSVQWSNACRLRVFLRRVKEKEDGEDIELDPTERELEVMKANWSATGETITMNWKCSNPTRSSTTQHESPSLRPMPRRSGRCWRCSTVCGPEIM